MIGSKLHLNAVDGLRIRASHHRSVVDQGVDLYIELLDVLDGLLHRCLTVELKVNKSGLDSWRPVLDILDEWLDFGARSSGQYEQGGAPLGKTECCLRPYTTRARSSDQDYSDISSQRNLGFCQLTCLALHLICESADYLIARRVEAEVCHGVMIVFRSGS